MSFFQRHLLTGVGLLLGPLISIVGIVLHSYALIEMGLPIEIIGLVIFFLSVVGVLYQQHRDIATATRPQNNKQTQPTLPISLATRSIARKSEEREPSRESRIYSDMTPKALSDFYTDRTMAEGDRLAFPYLNKWLRLTGVVHDVKIYDAGNGTVFTEGHNGLLTLRFKKEWKSSIEVLRTGDSLKTEGRLVEIGLSNLVLEDCEIC